MLSSLSLFFLLRILLLKSEYPEVPNDERVDPSLNSDQKSQSDRSHSSVPSDDVNIADIPSGNSGNDAKAVVTSLLNKLR
ncbi:hypothetical protein Tco_0897373, partial [Tanacetum coccineum]